MSCKKINEKKYLERPTPPYHANDCENLIKNGNDGKKYISLEDKNGVYKWKKIEDEKKYKQYYILSSSYEIRYIVKDFKEYVEIYNVKYLEDSIKKSGDKMKDIYSKYIPDKKLSTIKYKKIFLAKEPSFTKGKLFWHKLFVGNSLLLEIKEGQYIYIGSEIYKFDTYQKETIQKFYSYVDGGWMCYPYAIAEDNVYLFLEKTFINNELVKNKKDPYLIYVEPLMLKDKLNIRTVKNKLNKTQLEETKEKLQEAKNILLQTKKLKTKKIL